MNKEIRRRMQGKIGVIGDRKQRLKVVGRMTFHKLGNLSSLFPGEVEIRNELITGKPQETSAYFQYGKVKLQQVTDCNLN